MPRTRAQRAIRALRLRVARGELPAAEAAARVALIHEAQTHAVYRAALDGLARNDFSQAFCLIVGGI